MYKKLTFVGLSALLLLVIAGCGNKPEAAPAASAGPAGSETVTGAGGNNAGAANAEATAVPTASADTAAPTAEASPEAKQSQTIDVYYTDPEQMDLVAAKAEISFADDTEKYTAAYQALQTSTSEQQVPLWSKIELLKLDFKDGQVTLNVHKPDEAQLGAGGEALAISALAKTFFQFDDVKSLDVLVDGEQVESLMGHVDLEHPMTRDNSGL